MPLKSSVKNKNGPTMLSIHPGVPFCQAIFSISLILVSNFTPGGHGRVLEERVGNDAVTNVRVGGYVGCKISESVCLEHEYCYDDDLFGTCRSYEKSDQLQSKYRLTTAELEELGTLLEGLARLGYKWRHFYTQCAVTSLLLTYKGEAVLDPSICETVTRLVATPNIKIPPPPRSPVLTSPYDGVDYIVDPELQHDFPDESIRNLFRILSEPNDYSSSEDYQSDSSDGMDGFMEKKRYSAPSEEDIEENIYDIDYLDEVLRGLSKDDLKILKEMILQEVKEAENSRALDEKRAPIRHYETHESPDMITTVQVKYNPPEDEEEGDEENTQETSEEESPEEYLDTGENSENLLRYMDPSLRKELLNQNIVSKDDLYNYDDSNDLKENVYYYDRNEEKPTVESAGTKTSGEAGESAPPQQLPPLGPLHVPNPYNVMPRTPSPAEHPDENDVKSKALLLSNVGSLPVNRNRQKYLITMFILCGVVAALILAAAVLYFVRRHARFHSKISQWSHDIKDDETKATGEYQDLCRAHMQSKLSEKLETTPVPSRKSEAIHSASVGVTSSSMTSSAAEPIRTTSTGSSTSSWTEEPVNTNMDISTGHLVLSYMENHLQNKDRLQKEWDLLCAYDPEPCSIVAAIEPTNMRKNRYTDILPYEHCRVKLNIANSVSNSDYINASNIMDHDPRNPAYIVTQGPLPHTVADFWQMVWEQGSVVVVNLTKLVENSVTVCNRYWPEEGSDLYHIYEVHLVSEHSWSEDYVVRSFYLKNLQTNETRTITQFHFLSWPNLNVPSSAKALLEFRRKVNKSYKGRSCPVIVHCSDGAGRSGTYCLIDMVLNRLAKGAKEIDISATLEHIRDQRVNMVRTKEQFEFALSAVAQEVHTMLQSPGS